MLCIRQTEKSGKGASLNRYVRSRVKEMGRLGTGQKCEGLVPLTVEILSLGESGLSIYKLS